MRPINPTGTLSEHRPCHEIARRPQARYDGLLYAHLPLLLVSSMLGLGCTGSGETPFGGHTGGEAGDDSGDLLQECPAPPEVDLSGCLVTLIDDADPTRDEPDTTRAWYDDDGHLAAWKAEDGDEPDENTLNCVYEMDASGHLVSERCWGMSTYTYEWTWSDGLITSQAYDRDSDGSTDRSWTYTYDDQQLVHQSWDTDMDGSADGGVDYTWVNGLLTAEHWDYDGDGVSDLVQIYDHDEHGYVALLETDSDADGTPDDRTTWLWDSAGNPLLEEVDAGANGLVTLHTEWFYDEDCINDRMVATPSAGHRIVTVRDWEDDGFLKRERDYLDETQGYDAKRSWSRSCPWGLEPPVHPDDS